MARRPTRVLRGVLPCSRRIAIGTVAALLVVLLLAPLPTQGRWTAATEIEHGMGDADGPRVGVDAFGNALVVWRQWDGESFNLWSNRFVPGEGWTGDTLVAGGDGHSGSPELAVAPDGSAVAVWVQQAGSARIWASRFVGGEGWSEPGPIEAGDGHADSPVVAVDADGNAVAVWEFRNDTVRDIQANRFVVGEGWGDPVSLDDPVNTSRSPHAAVAADGSALAVWAQVNGSRTDVQSRLLTPGDGWGPAELVEQNATASAHQPHVARDGDGNALAVWVQDNESVTDVWANRFVVGQGWGNPVLLEANETEDANRVIVAAAPDGSAVATWVQDEGTTNSVWASHFVPGEGWGLPTLLEARDEPIRGSLDVAMNVQGNALVSWSQQDGLHTSIWANRYQAERGWGVADLLETDGGVARKPSVALDDMGNGFVVWQHDEGEGVNIRSSRFVRDSGWGEPALLEEDDSGHVSALQLAMDPGGNATVVWTQQNETTDNLWANRFTPEDGWGSPVIVWGADLRSPAVAADSLGNALVAWQEHNGTGWHIWASRFQPDAGWGTPQRLSVNDTGNHFRPAAAMDPEGNAQVVWEHRHAGGSNVTARRFAVEAGWEEPVLVEAGPGGVSLVQVAADTGGNMVAVWEQGTGTGERVAASRFVPGVGWSLPVLIDTEEDKTQTSRLRVTMDPGGNATVVWIRNKFLDPSTTRYDLWAARLEPTEGWGEPVLLQREQTPKELDMPDVDADGAGGARAVWGYYDSVEWKLLTERFRPDAGWGDRKELGSGEGRLVPLVRVTAEDNATVVWAQHNRIWARHLISEVGWTETVLLDRPSSGSASPALALDSRGRAVAVWVQREETSNGWANRFVPDTTPPVLQVTAPTATVTNDTSVTVAGQTEPRAWVTVDGVPVTVDPEGRFATTLTLPDGDHAFKVVAMDSWGNANATKVTLTVDTQAPPLLITTPTTDLTNASTVTVAGVTDPGVQVFVNGTAVPVADDGTFALETTLPDGDHAFEVVARDPAGNVAQAVLSLTVDTVAPFLSLDRPADGTTVTEAKVGVAGTTEPGAEVTVNGLGVPVDADGAFALDLALEEGENLIVVTSRDAAGNAVSVRVTVTYTNPLPGVEEELEETRTLLDQAREALEALQRQLREAQETTEAQLAALGSQTVVLSAVLAVFGIATGALLLAYLRLRGRLRE